MYCENICIVSILHCETFTKCLDRTFFRQFLTVADFFLKSKFIRERCNFGITSDPMHLKKNEGRKEREILLFQHYFGSWTKFKFYNFDFTFKSCKSVKNKQKKKRKTLKLYNFSITLSLINTTVEKKTTNLQCLHYFRSCRPKKSEGEKIV